MFYTFLTTPVGELILRSDGTALTGLDLATRCIPTASETQSDRQEPFDEVKRQLAEYFRGDRVAFDVPLCLVGTDFQKSVWKQLQAIPYGSTISYGELGKRLGNPNASRAVGLANGRNPVAIIVPCHRVIGADGSLTGYACGLDMKRALLDLEQGIVQPKLNGLVEAKPDTLRVPLRA